MVAVAWARSDENAHPSLVGDEFGTNSAINRKAQDKNEISTRTPLEKRVKISTQEHRHATSSVRVGGGAPGVPRTRQAHLGGSSVQITTPSRRTAVHGLFGSVGSNRVPIVSHAQVIGHGSQTVAGKRHARTPGGRASWRAGAPAGTEDASAKSVSVVRPLFGGAGLPDALETFNKMLPEELRVKPSSIDEESQPPVDASPAPEVVQTDVIRNESAVLPMRLFGERADRAMIPSSAMVSNMMNEHAESGVEKEDGNNGATSDMLDELAQLEAQLKMSMTPVERQAVDQSAADGNGANVGENWSTAQESPSFVKMDDLLVKRSPAKRSPSARVVRHGTPGGSSTSRVVFAHGKMVGSPLRGGGRQVKVVEGTAVKSSAMDSRGEEEGSVGAVLRTPTASNRTRLSSSPAKSNKPVREQVKAVSPAQWQLSPGKSAVGESLKKMTKPAIVVDVLGRSSPSARQTASVSGASTPGKVTAVPSASTKVLQKNEAALGITPETQRRREMDTELQDALTKCSGAIVAYDDCNEVEGSLRKRLAERPGEGRLLDSLRVAEEAEANHMREMEASLETSLARTHREEEEEEARAQGLPSLPSQANEATPEIRGHYRIDDVDAYQSPLFAMLHSTRGLGESTARDEERVRFESAQRSTAATSIDRVSDEGDYEYDVWGRRESTRLRDAMDGTSSAPQARQSMTSSMLRPDGVGYSTVEKRMAEQLELQKIKTGNAGRQIQMLRNELGELHEAHQKDTAALECAAQILVHKDERVQQLADELLHVRHLVDEKAKSEHVGPEEVEKLRFCIKKQEAELVSLRKQVASSNAAGPVGSRSTGPLEMKRLTASSNAEKLKEARLKSREEAKQARARQIQSAQKKRYQVEIENLEGRVAALEDERHRLVGQVGELRKVNACVESSNVALKASMAQETARGARVILDLMLTNRRLMAGLGVDVADDVSTAESDDATAELRERAKYDAAVQEAIAAAEASFADHKKALEDENKAAIEEMQRLQDETAATMLEMEEVKCDAATMRLENDLLETRIRQLLWNAS